MDITIYNMYYYIYYIVIWILQCNILQIVYQNLNNMLSFFLIIQQILVKNIISIQCRGNRSNNIYQF